MITQRYTPEFKEKTVKQVVEGGYTVPNVAGRLRLLKIRGRSVSCKNIVLLSIFWVILSAD